MDIKIKRQIVREDGVFSTLAYENDAPICVALEHAYDDGAKLPTGVYTCKRGHHKLHGMVDEFEPFEITGVVGHSGILFHWGNYNRDSEGCVLLGLEVARLDDAPWMITNSKLAFSRFMALQSGVDSFTLTVE